MQPVPDITVDTGAGASAANLKTFGGCKLEESPGSKAGQFFIGANGGRMANLGQVRPRLMMENGFLGRFTFQAADGIRKEGPLLAVSEVNAKGNPAWFDGQNSYILAGGSPEVEKLRSLIQDYGSKIPLHLKNGVYKLKAWAPNDPAGFPRPGA